VLAGTVYGTAVDASGNVYVAGMSSPPPAPEAPGAVLGPTGVGDAFVTKFAPDGASVLYATYFGGSGQETGYSVAVDAEGRAVVAGLTRSADFPTANGADGSFGGGLYDAFVAKLTADGAAFVYSTYLGGANDDWAWGVAADGEGSAYVTGGTASPDFPLSTPFQSALNRGQSTCPACFDAFVTKLDATGGLAYSTYFGGRWSDAGTAVAVDGAGRAHITGYSSSTDLPSAGSFYNHDSSGLPPDGAFFSRLDANGTSLLRSSWLSDAQSRSYGNTIALDAAGAVYVAGTTDSPNFPITPGAVQMLYGGGTWDAFVAKFNDQGEVYRSFLGGSGDDQAEAIAVDAGGRAYVAGSTSSANYPLTACLRGFAGVRDGFVTRLSALGDAAEYSTFFGGSGNDYALGVAFEPGGDVLVAGTTDSTDFPLLNGVTTSEPVGSFVARISAASGVNAGTIGFVTDKTLVSESAGSVSVGVVRQCGTVGAASVQFATAGDSAVPGVNYAETSGDLSFADGEAGPKTITVPILGDGFITCEGLSFQVTLASGTGAGLGLRSTEVLIQDGDEGRTEFRRPFEIKDQNLPTGPQWQASVGPESPWLTLSAYAGTGPSTVDAIVNITGLEQGQYTGIITVSAPSASSSPQEIFVDLFVESGGGASGLTSRTRQKSSTDAKKGGRQ
jgi:hypothetical protein